MAEQFVVVFKEEAFDTLGLMDMKSGVVEYLPPLPSNIRVAVLDEHYPERYYTAGYRGTLCFLAQVYSSASDYVTSLVSYNSTTGVYTEGVSDFAVALLASIGVNGSYPELGYDRITQNWSFEDQFGCWVWATVTSGLDSPKYIFAVNIETFEIQLVHTLPYLALLYYSYEDVGMVTKDFVVMTDGGYGESKLYAKGNYSFPILDPDISAKHTVLGMNDGGTKALWHAVDGDDWQAYLIQSDLAAGTDSTFRMWFQNEGPTALPDIVLANKEASELVWPSNESVMWMGASGIVRTYSPPPSENVWIGGLTYFSKHTDDIFFVAQKYEVGIYPLIVRRDGTISDLGAMYPDAYTNGKSLEVIGTWDNTPAAPQRFWMQLVNTEEVI
ncbi:MAG: hypothetical protein RBR22_08245 [Desulfuromonas sp.]|nr:hypothetical protein [Desulfuromonas sp.]